MSEPGVAPPAEEPDPGNVGDVGDVVASRRRALGAGIGLAVVVATYTASGFGDSSRWWAAAATILVAVALSLVNFVRRLWRPYDAVLGRIEKRRGYHDVDRNPDAREVPGLVLFRFDAPLFFANAEHFVRRIQEIVAESDQPVQRIVVAAEPITDIDTTGAQVLEQLLDELDEAGIELGFAELKGPVRDRLEKYGLADRALRLNDPTVGRAVSRYLRDHEVAWQDWTD